MSVALMQSLRNWQEASHRLESMAVERGAAGDEKRPAPPPIERKKPDDTEGGTCD